jgi:hypothetical protein
MVEKEFQLWKAIWEVRYPAAGLLFDKRGEIATKWQFQEDLTEWRISNNQVVIHNLSKTRMLLTSLGRMSVTEELPKNYKTFSNLALTFTNDVLDTISVSKISRIGLRLLFVSPSKSFKGLVRRIGKKIYKLEEQDWNILGGYPEDIAFPLVLKIGENKANFKFGPMEKEQYQRDEVFSTEEALQKMPPVSLFIDFDLYKLDPLGKSRDIMLKEFLDNGGSHIQDTVVKFRNYLEQ